MSNTESTEVGLFNVPQEKCPECGELDNIQDVSGDCEREVGVEDLFVSCFECGYQWHEPRVISPPRP